VLVAVAAAPEFARITTVWSVKKYRTPVEFRVTGAALSV
jgi:hypothetical protein